MPPLRQEGSLLNEASLRDLAEVAEGHRQQPHHDFSPKHDADRWRALLVAAAEQDVYTTANLALRRISELKAQHPSLFAQLTCVGSEVIESQRLDHGPLLSYYIVGGREEGGDSLQTGRRPFLPAKVGIDTGLSSACFPANFLALPVRYEAPAVISARRILPLHERDINVEEVATQKSGSTQWRVVSAEEEMTRVTFNVSAFVLSVVELPSGQYLVAVYGRSADAPDHIVERNVQVLLADQRGDKHQVVVSSSSSSPPSKKRAAPVYRGRRGADPNSRTLMSYNIWNYNADWQERKRLIAQFISKQQPDIVGVQEIRYKYSGGPDQLTDLVNELQLLNQTYNHVYQPAMYYDNEARFSLSLLSLHRGDRRLRKLIRAAEGVGVLSRVPIAIHEYINLTFVPGTTDGNRRIVLRTLLMDANNAPFNFFVSHFTYAIGEGQMSNAFELFNFMRRQRPDVPQSVVADFNIYVGHEEPTNFLTGKLSYRGVKGDLKDVWLDAHGTSEPGYTFSNLPWSSGLINRADRILVRNMPYILSQPNTTVTTGRVTPGANPASDHLAVASHVSYVTNNTWTRP
ncbi:endonuclease/exonuclease/phosphatase family protein [Acanthamoeba castellanii str. Neff]|uniref:Endonuclease/exonuclease/phosphatase family protein n=1 Tax=Acanthamoeba castellanii (strain ATCC 30010 / Neff) TaxID=1257118 RepID=L8GV68_ACACF|nr:endonuclease/exonuclease/phosphatase family protein [Acanthamoeba castellanii str. Neff]ELR16837.1 endonuclease/exonuclease/phosphatase family protein [Acanthamoeba castellanii str. Neff]